jgi:Sigma-70, region 4
MLVAARPAHKRSYGKYADEAAEPYRVLEGEESERVRSAGLQNTLATLDPRSRRIVEARWLREENALTLHDLAAELKVSAERIRQIEAKALDKMRQAMAPRDAPLVLPSPSKSLAKLVDRLPEHLGRDQGETLLGDAEAPVLQKPLLQPAVVVDDRAPHRDPRSDDHIG